MNEKKYWNKKAWIYNRLFDNTKLYQQMYAIIKTALSKDMTILEVGTGTGMIARKIADGVKMVYATDFSPKMIEVAKQIEHKENIRFSCADIFNIPFAENSFDAVIASNILHIIPNPDLALKELKRVLKTQGTLIVPTFMWFNPSLLGYIKMLFMRLNGFPIHSKWSEQSFSDFIKTNGFKVTKKRVLKSSLQLCYLEAVRYN